jgi:hypothetical protein
VTSLVTGVIGLSVAALIIILMRRDRLHAGHGLAWIVVAVGFALLGLLPEFFDRVAAFLGIASAPLLALTLAIAILVIKILMMDIERSRLELRNQRLVQRVGMLEADMKKFESGKQSGDQSASSSEDSQSTGQNHSPQ